MIEERKRQVDSFGRAYGTGKRKASIARVWIKLGSGKILINKRFLSNYFNNESAETSVLSPFGLTSTDNQFDVMATAKGGGISGQAGALRLGIARALQNFNPELRASLKAGGLLTRDSRVVERKKYGRKKARKSFQFSKR